MGGKFKGKSEPGKARTSLIRSGGPADVLTGLMRFSFKFYEPGHPRYHCRDRDAKYFQAFLDRIKALSCEVVTALTNAKSNRTTRFHQIRFEQLNVSADGFGIRGWEQYEQDAWQFSLSANEDGRVHGFLIEDVFYVVWLDAEHQLYPGT